MGEGAGDGEVAECRSHAVGRPPAAVAWVRGLKLLFAKTGKLRSKVKQVIRELGVVTHSGD